MTRFTTISERLEGLEQAQANFELLLFFKRLLKLILLGIKPIIVFDGEPPELKKRTLVERFRQRYQSEKNYKKMAQRFVMNALENKQKRRSTGSQTSETSQSQPENPSFMRQLTEEQEAEFAKIMEEFENALEEREFEEVKLYFTTD